jgi:chemotaxis signal transduction protein
MSESGGARYLITEVAGQRFAWDLATVREIVPARSMTRLPGAPVWVVLTVIDLAARLALVAREGESVVVLDVDGRALGVRVDRVRVVAAAEQVTVETVEAARGAAGLVSGMVRSAEGTAALVDAVVLCRSVLATA